MKFARFIGRAFILAGTPVLFLCWCVDVATDTTDKPFFPWLKEFWR